MKAELCSYENGICDHCKAVRKVAVLDVECGGYPEPKFCFECVGRILEDFNEGYPEP